MKTGAQLYTVRLFTQTVPDFRETMRRVAEIGYETVQMSATGSEITPQIAREIADEMGLKIVLTHSDINRIRKDTEQLIRDHEVMGCKYIGIGSMPEKYRNPDWIRRFAVDFKEPARMIKEAGMRIGGTGYVSGESICLPGKELAESCGIGIQVEGGEDHE